MLEEEPQALEEGALLGARYRIGSLIESGAVGAVYEATDEREDAAVAVKVLHYHLEDDQEQVERFRREADAAGRLGHPGIVRVREFAFDGNRPFLVMERLVGAPLSRIFADGGMHPERAVRITTSILDALATAHGAGIVHRDLKPANVVVGDEDAVTLVDFGIAKLLGDGKKRLTRFGMILGSPRWASPEQARGEDVDHRTDLFQVGLLLFTALAGRSPHESEVFEQVVRTLARGRLPSLSIVAPEVPPALCAVVDRALEPDRTKRFQSAGEMRAALSA